jgi:hypothetical protein
MFDRLTHEFAGGGGGKLLGGGGGKFLGGGGGK